jgi:hypothetical protein
MGTTLVRGAVVLLAVVVAAWLAVSFRNARLEADGQAVATRAQQEPIPASEVEQARDDLRSAGRLSPDQAPRVVEGGLLLASGHRGEAAALARQAVADEPDNVDAWFLAFASARDRAEAIRAKGQILRLNPWAGELLHP